jgi:hypothetical protein
MDAKDATTTSKNIEEGMEKEWYYSNTLGDS